MEKIIEKQKKTMVTQRCEVLVAGGGIAGISAALAAARSGADVLLVDKQCMLGGLATLGLITVYLPLCDGEGRQVSFGISEELLHLSIKYGAQEHYPAAWLENGTIEERRKQRFEVQYNPYFFAAEVEQLLLDAGVRILYDTLICGTAVENGKITHVITESKSGRGAIALNSAVDCTGDAVLCSYAGAKIRLFAQKNILANWYYYNQKGKLSLAMLGYADIPEEYKKNQEGPKLLVDKKFSGLDAEENSEMLCLARSAMMQHILKIRETEPSHTPVAIPTIPQLRMTRCMEGAYILDDKETHKYFEDSIGMIGDWRKRGPVYEIPYRTLYGKEVKNLITAGRNISVTDSMWDASRVIPACAVTGEAAGLCAALTNDFEKLDIAYVQKKLIKNGVILHGTELDS